MRIRQKQSRHTRVWLRLQKTCLASLALDCRLCGHNPVRWQGLGLVFQMKSLLLKRQLPVGSVFEEGRKAGVAEATLE